MFNVPPTTLRLVLAIVAVFIIIQLNPAGVARVIVGALGVVPAHFAAAAGGPLQAGTLWELATLLTHAFVHVDFLHVAVNAGFLLAFGSACERLLGGRGLLVVFLASAVGGAAAQLAVDWGEMILLFGASGGVSGCMGGLTRQLLADRASPERRRFGLNLILVMFGINLLFALFGGAIMGVDAQVAWQAHLGGFAVGFLVAGRPLAAPARRS